MTWDPHSRLLTTAEAAQTADRSPATITRWWRAGHITPHSWLAGEPLWLEMDVLTAEGRAREARNARRGPRLPDLT